MLQPKAAPHARLTGTLEQTRKTSLGFEVYIAELCALLLLFGRGEGGGI